MMASINALSPSTRSVSFQVRTESRMERYFSPSSRWEAPPVESAVNCDRSVDTASEAEAGAGDDMKAEERGDFRIFSSSTIYEFSLLMSLTP